VSKGPRNLITCARCREQKKHCSRNLCGRCERQAYADGTLANYPRTTIPRQDIIEEMGSPAMRGRSYVDIAVSMGMKPRSAMTSYWRARKAGHVT
jgi:hypothetical protein